MANSASPRIKPPALRPGDTLGIVAPASNVRREALEKGCDALRDLGYKPFYLDSIFEQDIYFAGSLERRARELEEMFLRNEVRAIICARGGYGSNYLLQAVDLEIIKAHPKVFVGYSDVTCLLTHFLDSAGLVTFHGPMAIKDFGSSGIDVASWQGAVSGAQAWTVPLNPQVKPLVEGAAEGVLYGGCLSILVASLGTPYEIQTEGTILFLEDIAAKPYQIDRMLMQLRLSGKLNHVRGIIFGEMQDCLQNKNVPEKDQGYTLQEVIVRLVADFKIPVAYGLRSGHVTQGNITLPFGVRASFTVHNENVELKILEAATNNE